MRIPRLYFDDGLEAGSAHRLPPDRAHYVVRVLRLGPGSALLLFNGDGFDYMAEIVGLGKSGVDVRVAERVPAVPRSPIAVTLVQALCRGERMDYALQKATELGAAAFQPVDSARSEVRLRQDRVAGRMAHWRSVIVAACEQCRRADLPELRPPVTLSGWARGRPCGLRLVLDPDAGRSLAHLDVPREVELVVGPEGGFDDVERALLASAEVQPARLGPRVLRAETAGPAALAVLQSMVGDFA